MLEQKCILYPSLTFLAQPRTAPKTPYVLFLDFLFQIYFFIQVAIILKRIPVSLKDVTAP